jgi:hypothetical protein
MLADACLDSNTVTTFIAFLNNDLSKLIAPEEIIDTTDFKGQVYERIKSMVDKETKRVDILSVIATRFMNYINTQVLKTSFNARQIDNIKSFLKLDFMPNDIRMVLAQELNSTSAGTELATMIWSDPELSQLFLKNWAGA